jgi:UDP-glucose 4-epimerase
VKVVRPHSSACTMLCNESRGLPLVEIKTQYHSTWLDKTEAKFLLSRRPEYNLGKMIDGAFDYVRTENDPRKV